MADIINNTLEMLLTKIDIILTGLIIGILSALISAFIISRKKDKKLENFIQRSEKQQKMREKETDKLFRGFETKVFKKIEEYSNQHLTLYQSDLI